MLHEPALGAQLLFCSVVNISVEIFLFPPTVGDIGMSGPFMVHPALSFLPFVSSVWKTLPVFLNSMRSLNSRGSTFLWEGGQAGHEQSSKS